MADPIQEQAHNAAAGASAEAENRRSLRVPYNRDQIEVVLLSEQGEREELQATGRNFSKGGVGVLVDREITQGTRCEVVLETLSGQIRRMTGKAVFGRQFRNELYEVGLAFDEVVDLEEFVTLQRVQRMIYEKEKRAAAAKAERVHAHAVSQCAGEKAGQAAVGGGAARPIVSKLAGKPAEAAKLSAYLDELSSRAQALADAAQEADLSAMRAVTHWVLETAQPHGYPTLFAVANVVDSYLDEEAPADAEFIHGQVMELVGYLRRARAHP